MNTATDTNEKPNARIIERAKKLYAMSQDASSMHEAEIALRRVESLMKQYGLTVADLEDSPFGTGVAYSAKTIPTWFKYMSLGIAAFNDCICGGARNSEGCEFIYEGFEQDVLMATLMQEYLVATMERSWKEFKKTANYTGKSASTSFKNGFATVIQDRLFEMTHQREVDSEELAMLNCGDHTQALTVVKMAMVNEEFGKQRIKSSRDRVSDGGANAAGKAAGHKAGLNRQVGGKGQRLLA